MHGDYGNLNPMNQQDAYACRVVCQNQVTPHVAAANLFDGTRATYYAIVTLVKRASFDRIVLLSRRGDDVTLLKPVARFLQ